jgi:hypothetical protein
MKYNSGDAGDYKAIPTQEAMDDWLAQRYGLDLNSIPRT